jgi:hypothetical protein
MKMCHLSSVFKASLSKVLIISSSLAALAFSASAANLVVNGGFEQLLVPGYAAQFGSDFPSQQATGWTGRGYNFVFTPGSADTTGSYGVYRYLYLWGPANGAANGLPATSPAGGNFVAMDGAFDQGPISQTIHGLTPGKNVDVSFYFAGAQQEHYDGATTEQFQVSLGSEQKFTPVLHNASHGFTGWQYESIVFTPTSSSEVLSFLALGTPGGVPPFSLLVGVSIYTPEPASFALLMISVAGFGVTVLRRAKTIKK